MWRFALVVLLIVNGCYGTATPATCYTKHVRDRRGNSGSYDRCLDNAERIRRSREGDLSTLPPAATTYTAPQTLVPSPNIVSVTALVDQPAILPQGAVSRLHLTAIRVVAGRQSVAASITPYNASHALLFSLTGVDLLMDGNMNLHATTVLWSCREKGIVSIETYTITIPQATAEAGIEAELHKYIERTVVSSLSDLNRPGAIETNNVVSWLSYEQASNLCQ